MSDGFKLPLRLFGFENMPAVPIDLEGMVETLTRLDARARETELATQGLARSFTLNGESARAHAFLFGGEPADSRHAAARERLRGLLAGHPEKTLATLADLLKRESDELYEDLIHSHAESAVLTTLPLEDPNQWSMSWTTVPDVLGLGQPRLDRWASTVDVDQADKATLALWPTIATYGLAYNLILPKKVDATDIDEMRKLFGDALDTELETAFGAGLLYVIDLRIHEALEPHHVKGFTRFTPSTVTLFVQDAATKAMTPELVRVAGYRGAGARVFDRRQATSAAWVYALQAVKTSVTVYGIWLGHVYPWHLVTAAMQMTMFDELSEDNPVRRFLGPQSRYLIPFDDVLLFLWRFLAPPTSVKTGYQFLELADLFATDREFFDDDPTATLERLGLTWRDFSSDGSIENRWDRYPIVGQLLSIWRAVAEYVDVYVDRSYPTDAEVENDKELQKWIEASGDKRGGNVRGLPEMDSKDALKRVLTSLVYRITAHGASRLYRVANPALTFVANFPPCLQDATIPEPSTEFDTRTLLAYLPKTGTIGEMIKFYFTFSFSVPYAPFVPLEGLESHLYLGDDASNKALIRLRRFIIRFVETYQSATPQIYQWPLNIET